MSVLIRRIAFPILALTAALLACTANPTPLPPPTAAPTIDIAATIAAAMPTPAPTPDLGATVAASAVATIAAIPTPTPAPTGTPQPTYTPYPTATPYPTPEPWPTHTPYPTAMALPTYTPYPTATAYPTATPYPTPRPVTRIQTVVETDNWKARGSTLATNIGTYATIGSGASDFWILNVSCRTDETFIWLNDTNGTMFSDSWSYDSDTESLLVTIDGRTEEQSWYYFPPEGTLSDFYSARWGHNLLSNILGAKKLEITIPTSGDDYVISFDVEGLDRYISSASDCGSG